MKYQNKPTKKELAIIMSAGCLLGILCFGIIYGFKILDFTYDGWLFHGDMDLKQHYLGFCHYRTSPWQFPIGIIDSLSVPYSMSVVYTDSIPLFALIFKVFSNVLPVHFQYFGLFGLLCYMLMGMLSPVLIRRFTDSKVVCILGSLFFTVSFPVLHRLYYHTALTAQWIIILALIVWFYNDINDKNQTKKLCIIWALIGILSVSIHSYFVFMTGIVLAAQTAEGLISYIITSKKEKRDSGKVKTKKSVLVDIILIILPVICMCVFAFITLYVFGGFYGSGSVSGDGFGSFNANLSSYVNPLTYGSVFEGFELNGMFEYEGFAYVGAGVIIILISALTYIVLYSLMPYKSRDNKNEKLNDEVPKKNSLLSNISLRKIIIFFTIIFVLLISCFPTYSYGSKKIIGLPVPKILASILGICRTNARFVWVGMYLIIISAIYFIGKLYKSAFIKILFAIAVIIQLYDISGVARDYHNHYSEDMSYESEWTVLEPLNILYNKKEFVFMYNDSLMMMDSAYYGYIHNISQNSYYYARTIYDEIDVNIAEWTDEFLSGTIRDDIVYVFRKEDYTDEFSKVVRENSATESEFNELIVITK